MKCVERHDVTHLSSYQASKIKEKSSSKIQLAFSQCVVCWFD